MFWLYIAPVHSRAQGSERQEGRGVELGRREIRRCASGSRTGTYQNSREVAILAIGTTTPTRLGSLRRVVLRRRLFRITSPLPSRAFASWCRLSPRISFPTPRRRLVAIRSCHGRELFFGCVIYYSTNRSGAVPILARNANSSEDLADLLAEVALTRDGILNDDLQRRVMSPLLSGLGAKIFRSADFLTSLWPGRFMRS